MHKHPSHILLSPRITEKAAYLSEKGCWVFNVAPDAGKREIVDAVRLLYKVNPRKVTVARLPRKVVSTRGSARKGTTGGGKKAYVYLKQGDSIELA